MKMKKLVIVGIGIVVGIFSIQSILAQVVEIRPVVKKTVVYRSAVKTDHVWVTGHWKWNWQEANLRLGSGKLCKGPAGQDLD